MDLFKFIDVLFRKDGNYEKLTPYERGKNFFMTNRFMAISYPYVANQLQHIRVNTASVMDYWHRSLSQVYGHTPTWIYTKTKGVKKEKSGKVVDIDTIKQYASHHSTSIRDVEQAMKWFPEDMNTELKEFELYLNGGAKITERKRKKSTTNKLI